MNSKNIIPIPRDKVTCTCFKCLKETINLNRIDIPEMGYGGGFDGFGTTLYLCNDCYEASGSELWSMEEKQLGEYFSEYVHDDEMWEYINNLPLQSQELVCNTLPTGFNADYTMEPQDWIDYELDELPYEKCKEYGVYAPEEINAYKERYPKCKHVYNQIFSDGSKSSSCYMKSCTWGEYGGAIGLNPSTKCYKCQYFEERTEPIKDVNIDE